MSNQQVTSYTQLHDLVASVEHGRPRTLSLVETMLEVVRAFVPAEIASSITVVLSAPCVLDGDEEIRL